MTKNIIISGITILFMAGIVWIARPDSSYESLTAPAENLIVENGNFNFGEISMADGIVSHVFRIRNSGDEPITIKKMYTSCMCTTASLMIGEKEFGPYGMPGHGFMPSINREVAPGEKVSVKVVFDPAAHGPAGIGPTERTVFLENSAGGAVNLQFSALIRP